MTEQQPKSGKWTVRDYLEIMFDKENRMVTIACLLGIVSGSLYLIQEGMYLLSLIFDKK